LFSFSYFFLASPLFFSIHLCVFAHFSVPLAPCANCASRTRFFTEEQQIGTMLKVLLQQAQTERELKRVYKQKRPTVVKKQKRRASLASRSQGASGQLAPQASLWQRAEQQLPTVQTSQSTYHPQPTPYSRAQYSRSLLIQGMDRLSPWRAYWLAG
jgi:hypothetical protein